MLTTFLLINEKIDRYSVIFLIFLLLGIFTYSIHSYGTAISLCTLIINILILIFLNILIKRFSKIKDKLVFIILIIFWLFVLYQLKFTYDFNIIWAIIMSLPILIISIVWSLYALLFGTIYIDIFLFNYIGQTLINIIN